MKAVSPALVILVAGLGLASCSYFVEQTPPQATPGVPPAVEGSTEPLPRTLAVKQFIIGPGDELTIAVWRQKDMDAECRVSPAGTISLPLVGEMPAAGRNLTDISQDITTALRKYYVDPKVSVAVKSTKGAKLYVLGEVQRPGLFAVEEPTNVLQAVAMAGGFTENAKRNSILLATGDLQRPSLHKLDLQAALSKGLFAENNPEVQRGDIIYVPATTIANVEIFFRRLFHILSPVVEAERAAIFGSQVPAVLQGEGKRTVVIGP